MSAAPPEPEPQDPTPLVIGVLGGIASGKSRVAARLAGPSGVVIEADRLAHGVLASDELRPRLVGLFGPGVLGPEGGIDRAAIAREVFSRPDLRRELERLVHPRVREAIAAALGQARAEGRPRIVLDVPLLLENDREHNLVAACDRLVFVDAPLALRERRARERRGWAAGEVARREAAQLPLAEKRARAHHVIDNHGDLAALEAAVDELLDALEGTRGGPRASDP